MSISSRYHRVNQSNSGTSPSWSSSSFRVKHFLKPRMLVIIALLFCWNLRNSSAISLYNPVSGGGNGGMISSQNGFPYFHHSPHHRSITSTVRLRAPSYLNQLSSSAQSDSSAMIPLGGAGLTPFSEEAAQIVGPLQTRPSIPVSSYSAVIPFGEEVLNKPRRKKDCTEPSIATRSLLGKKRSYFAYTQDEVDKKIQNDEYRAAGERRKRDIQHQQLSQQLSRTQPLSPFGRPVKRDGSSNSNGNGSGPQEAQESPLPWTCETQFEWEDMGADHYPRFVRTAKCKTKLCFNGFFRCKPRRYKTKVLKLISPSDSTSCEEDDVSLPEQLRSQWKFISVTINLCCDCTGRMPGTQ